MTLVLIFAVAVVVGQNRTTTDDEDNTKTIVESGKVSKTTNNNNTPEGLGIFQFWTSVEANKKKNVSNAKPSAEQNNKKEMDIEKEDEDDDDDDDYVVEDDDDEDVSRMGDLEIGAEDSQRRVVLEAADYGIEKMRELYEVQEPKLYRMGLWLEPDNPARFVATFNWQSDDARKFAQYGYASLQASTHLMKALNDAAESRTEAVDPPKLAKAKQATLRQQCPLKGTPRCPPASKRYRTHDGTCNNARRGRWGSAMTAVERFLPPKYEDEVSMARGSTTTLPSPRLISSVIHTGRRRDAPSVSHLLMQWGQFLDHDITSTAQTRAFNGSIPRCCADGGRRFVAPQFMHPECMPIEVPIDDDFYGPLGIRCLEFVRSSPASRIDCEFGWREQMNQVTAYIDASPIYSSSARQSDKLRIFRNGLLQYGRAQARRPLLPPREDDEEALCLGGAVDASCFKAGDGRVNEHPGLVAMHIIWLRKHNRIATELSHLNPHWSDEKVYQEARKIIGAMVQHITYGEFLPIVLGSEVMRLFDLELTKKGYYRSYSSKVNPSPANSFSAAAFRFGHSLVQDSFVRYDRFHTPILNNVSLHEELSNPANIWSVGAVDRLVVGMCNQASQRRDEYITRELTNHLFETSRFGFGTDLASINVQRGRDHGLPPYLEWRPPCGLADVRRWDDLYTIMAPDTLDRLRSVYRFVEDIDLFTGGMAERPVRGGLVGPTFACIIAQQFSNLRRGDRFWYENGGFESSFTPAQLQQLRRVTLAQILCQTLESIETVQPYVFMTTDNYDNARMSCRDLTYNGFDLTPWTERDFDSANTVNDFDRTNFVKSSSVVPSSSPKTPPNTSTNMTTILEHSTASSTTNIPLDDKLDLPNTTDTIKLDDKLDTLDDDAQSRSLEGSTVTNNSESNLKTYGFLLGEDSQLPFFSNLFGPNNKRTTTTPRPRPSPQINIVNQDFPFPGTTVSPEIFTYLINIVPRPTTPKYPPQHQETIKITVQGAVAPSNIRPQQQNYPFPYDKRPVYENNVLQYRPVSSNDRYDYSRPQTVPTNPYNNRPTFVHNDDFQDQTYNVNKRPYRPYRPTSDEYGHSTTESNPYNLVTFSHVEVPGNGYRPSSSSQNSPSYVQVINPRPTKPATQTDFNDGYGPTSRPTNLQQNKPGSTAITIYIENKPTHYRPTTENSISNFDYVRPISTSRPVVEDDEHVPLFTRPSFQKPFLQNTRPTVGNPYDSHLQSEHGQITNTWTYNPDRDDTYHKQTAKNPTNVNINLASEYGNQQHNSGISIVIDPYLKNKVKVQNSGHQSGYKSISTAKPPVKYYYIANVLHKYQQSKTGNHVPVHTTANPKNAKVILKENYNNVWKPDKDEQKLYNNIDENIDNPLQRTLDKTDDISRSEKVKSKNKTKGQVFFEVIPSENSPTTWMTYNEKPEDPTDKRPYYNKMPSLKNDPMATKELPRPINSRLSNKNIIKNRHHQSELS